MLKLCDRYELTTSAEMLRQTLKLQEPQKLELIHPMSISHISQSDNITKRLTAFNKYGFNTDLYILVVGPYVATISVTITLVLCCG